MNTLKYSEVTQKINLDRQLNLLNIVADLPGIILTGSYAFENTTYDSDIDFFISSDTVVGEGKIPIGDYLVSLGFEVDDRGVSYKREDRSIIVVLRYKNDVLGLKGIDIQLIDPDWYNAKFRAQEILLHAAFSFSFSFRNPILKILSNKDEAKKLWCSLIESEKAFEDDNGSK